MKKRILDLRNERPLLDIAAYARKGRLPTPAERLHISLTVHRAPEVMVKVSGGARTLSGVERHMAYIGREGKLGLDVDTEGHIGGTRFERDLVRDWDLDVDALQNHTSNSGSARKPPKLVHNIIFSMPPGTSPRAVLEAVQRLALNEWALQHRYAMALHTDDDHPHVHVVLKALSEHGVRLNIRKATLRAWREQFAANLRDLRVDANATERAVRGFSRTQKTDGIYRANLRGLSLHLKPRRDEALRQLSAGESTRGVGIAKLVATRKNVDAGWRHAGDVFEAERNHEMARRIRSFISQMPPVQTENQRLTNERRQLHRSGYDDSARDHANNDGPERSQ